MFVYLWIEVSRSVIQCWLLCNVFAAQQMSISILWLSDTDTEINYAPILLFISDRTSATTYTTDCENSKNENSGQFIHKNLLFLFSMMFLVGRFFYNDNGMLSTSIYIYIHTQTTLPFFHLYICFNRVGVLSLVSHCGGMMRLTLLSLPILVHKCIPLNVTFAPNSNDYSHFYFSLPVWVSSPKNCTHSSKNVSDRKKKQMHDVFFFATTFIVGTSLRVFSSFSFTSWIQLRRAMNDFAFFTLFVSTFHHYRRCYVWLVLPFYPYLLTMWRLCALR